MTPGSAVRHASVARHFTDCATRKFTRISLDGGVIFDTLANSNESHADGMSFQHFSVQYEFGF